MGFGAVYAWRVGSEHGLTLAALSVLFAVALEGVKPLAVSEAFRAVGRLHLIRGAALALLATVAVGYSLTAELSLMAGARGDLAAHRKAASDEATATARRRQHIEADLNALGTVRPSGEIQAELTAAISRDKRLTECGGWQPSKWARTLCIEEVAPRKAELAKAERREALERELSKLGTGAPQGAVQADPGAAALSTYLAALGFVVPVQALSQWLALVPVVALELGSALAVLLVRSVATPARSPVDSAEPREMAAPAVHAQPEQPVIVDSPAPQMALSKPGRKRGLGQMNRRGKAEAAEAILDTIAEAGGKLDGASVRKLAGTIGARKSTVHNALLALVASGAVMQAGGELVLRSTH